MFKNNSRKAYRRFYQIGGITIQVEADLPITDETFHPKFKIFEVDGPGEDTITIRHHFFVPVLSGLDLGEEIYLNPPWAIYRKEDSWNYLGISGGYSGGINRLWNQFRSRLLSIQRFSHQNDGRSKNTGSRLEKEWYIYLFATFNREHTSARIYNQSKRLFRNGNLHSLTLFPTDQILLARMLADRQACYLHSSGVVLKGSGFLFVGHSEAGKSTMVSMLKDKAQILCDDRIIVRKWPEGFKIHGTWSHSDVPDVSPDSAPLKAIVFLKKAHKNRLIPLVATRDVMRKLTACLIKPFVTADWWDKMLSLLETVAREVPSYTLEFDKSGRAVDLLESL